MQQSSKVHTIKKNGNNSLVHSGHFIYLKNCWIVVVLAKVLTNNEVVRSPIFSMSQGVRNDCRLFYLVTRVLFSSYFFVCWACGKCVVCLFEWMSHFCTFWWPNEKVSTALIQIKCTGSRAFQSLKQIRTKKKEKETKKNLGRLLSFKSQSLYAIYFRNIVYNNTWILRGKIWFPIFLHFCLNFLFIWLWFKRETRGNMHCFMKKNPESSHYVLLMQAEDQ